MSSAGPLRSDDYFALPAEPACELIHGRLYVSPAPHGRHQVVLGHLADRARAFARRSGGIALFAPVDVVLAEHTVVQPDLLYLSPERRDRFAGKVTGAPDWVVEVLSPATVRRDRGDKLQRYARHGVREYWIVDPIARQVEFLVRHVDRFVVHTARDDHYASPAIEGLTLDVAALWSDVDRDLPPALANYDR
jgi:Uma2 family endonuclease